nr:hypothetical protein [Rhodopirellula sp. SM50]
MTICFRGVIACVLAATLAAVSVNAAVVTNGSFETPDIPGGSSAVFFVPGETMGAGWVVDPASGSAVLILRETLGVHPAVLDGDQYAVIGVAPDFATIRQDVALDAASYRLSFQLAAAETISDAGISVDILRGGTSVVGGPAGFSVPTGSGFMDQSLDFTTSTADNYRIVLTATAGATAIDAFQITAIPEPSSVAVLAAISLPLVIRRRR